MKQLNEYIKESLIVEANDDIDWGSATKYADSFSEGNELGVLHTIFNAHYYDDYSDDEIKDEYFDDEDDMLDFIKAFNAIYDKHGNKFYFEGNTDDYDDDDFYPFYEILKGPKVKSSQGEFERGFDLSDCEVFKKANEVVAGFEEDYELLFVVGVVPGMSAQEKKFVSSLIKSISKH